MALCTGCDNTGTVEELENGKCTCGKTWKALMRSLRRLFRIKSKKSKPPTGMMYIGGYPKNMKKSLYYHDRQQGGENKVAKKEYTIKTTVAEVTRSRIRLEFGRTQGSLWITGTGLAARKLKPKIGDIMYVTLKKG